VDLVGSPPRAREGARAVTILDRRNHHLFQPLLYQVATGALNPSDIASTIRAILRRQRNAQVLLSEVRAIDSATRRLVLEEGSSRTIIGSSRRASHTRTSGTRLGRSTRQGSRRSAMGSR
jgi:NADH dehydrogenase FAD-containing subunit